jgi:hypothetical protein
LLAPTDALLALSAARTYLAANQSTVLTVRVTGLDGSPVEDGTEILFTADVGQLESRKVRTHGGSATATYRAGNRVARDRVVATSGTLRAELTIAVGSGEVARVELAVDPPVLPAAGGTATLVASARTAGSDPVAGAPVVFKTSAGTLKPADTVYTDENGRAQATLTTTAPATVSARALELVSEELAVRLRAPVRLTLAVSPTEPTVNSPATFTAAATLEANKPATGTLEILFGNGQSRDLGQVTGSAIVTHTYTRAGSFTATARFTYEDGTVTEAQLVVRVQEEPPQPPPGTPVPGVDMIDPSTITWLDPASTNVSGWTVSSHLYNVEIVGCRVCLRHTKAGRWPLVSIDDNPPNIEGNPMIVVNIGGKWYGAGFDWFGAGRECKELAPEEYGRDQIRVAPLDRTWPGPRSGEVYGFLVSTPSSNRIPVRSVNERTNIVLVRWP